ncbi:MAG: FAD-dependent oxidoreductase [Bacteroidetes bacterium]|nr:FAD-dependent oxidoreductase [Bacteroidota bacterium]
MRKPKSNLLHNLFTTLNKEVKEYKYNNENSSSINLYDRRKFLNDSTKGVIGLSLALSLPSFITSCNDGKSNDENVLDIAILGGGIAGLNCANHLLNSNLKFKIFEAQKRVGGRILTHYNDSLGIGVFPEFGGDFIDSNHEEMLALAKEFNLDLIDLEEEQKSKNLTKDIYYFENRKIDEKEVINEFQKIVEKISTDKVSLGEDYDTAEAEILDNTPLSDYIQSFGCKQWLKDLFTAAFVAEFGLECNLQSTLNFLDMIDTETSEGFKIFGESDERYRVKGGNSKIIEGLVKKIGEERIEKNSEVSAISENSDSSYTIIFKSGEKITAKSVVCTIPFTILRNIKLNLKNISSEKRKCIDELGYGMNTKLVLGYNGSPWSNSQNNAMGYLFIKTL